MVCYNWHYHKAVLQNAYRQMSECLQSFHWTSLIIHSKEFQINIRSHTVSLTTVTLPHLRSQPAALWAVWASICPHNATGAFIHITLKQALLSWTGKTFNCINKNFIQTNQKKEYKLSLFSLLPKKYWASVKSNSELMHNWQWKKKKRKDTEVDFRTTFPECFIA